MFLAVSRLSVQVGFTCSLFASPIGRVSKTVRPKNWASRNKFIRPCCLDNGLSEMPILAADDVRPDLRLCKLNFLGVVMISGMYSLKISLVLKYEIPFVFYIL